jgi:hypothetical protein
MFHVKQAHVARSKRYRRERGDPPPSARPEDWWRSAEPDAVPWGEAPQSLAFVNRSRRWPRLPARDDEKAEGDGRGSELDSLTGICPVQNRYGQAMAILINTNPAARRGGAGVLVQPWMRVGSVALFGVASGRRPWPWFRRKSPACGFTSARSTSKHRAAGRWRMRDHRSRHTPLWWPKWWYPVGLWATECC